MSIFPTFKRSLSAGNDYWYHPVGYNTVTGVKVSEKTALKYLTVFSCVTLISGDIGRLPLNLYRKRKGGGKDLVTDHKLYDLLHNAPNPDTTSYNFRETLQGHLLLWGNAYSFIERDKTNKVIALWQIPDPSQIDVDRVGGQIVYKYSVDGKPVTRRRDQMFHIPGYGFNGLVGMSMIGFANEAIGLGLATEQFGGRFFGAGTHLSGVYEIPGVLGKNAVAFKKELKEGFSGLGKSHNVMIAENGAKYKPLTLPLNDSQFLETRDHQKIEICGMYHVPPHKIAIHGQNSNYNNLEQENASYVDSCLMHWIVRWESAISLQLLSEEERRSGLYFKFAVQGLLRGDSAARADYYNKLFQVGGIKPDEIRALEEMNPVEGGDESFVMLNMVPLSQAKDMPLPGDEPEKLPIPEKKAVFLDFFGENRAKKMSDAKSIQLRDRIYNRYAPLILDAATAIVNRESKAIKKKVESQTRSKEVLSDFLDSFYDEFPKYINQKLGPVLRSFMNAIADATNTELNIDGTNLDTEMQDYIETYAKRHIYSSKGQMVALLEGQIDELSTRADDWQEKRPEQIKANEGVRASSFAFQAVVFGAGLTTVWRIRGPKTCPYCISLNGKRVASGQSFVKDGQELNPDGAEKPMRINGIKTHPTLHRGCDCYLSIG